MPEPDPQSVLPRSRHHLLGLLPDGAALNLTAAVRGRRRCCVLVPGLDVFVRPLPGRVLIEAERFGQLRASGRDLLPVLQYVRTLGFRLRRVRLKDRHPSDLVIEAVRIT